MRNSISLRCPDCKINLTGGNNSKIFFCTGCSICFIINYREIKKLKLTFSKLQFKKNKPMIYFPFFEFRTDYKILKKNPIINIKGQTIYVPAFFINNINDFGDIGYYYYQKKVVIQQDKFLNQTVYPADRNLDDVYKLPKIYITKYKSSEPESSYFQVEIKHLSYSVTLIPFYLISGEYHDSVSNWKYPSGAVI